MGGDEHQCGGIGEVGQDAGQFQPRQSRHVDIEKERVPGSFVEGAQRRHRVADSDHFDDLWVAPQQIYELVEGGDLVVDRQHPQGRHRTSTMPVWHIRPVPPDGTSAPA